MQRRRAGRIVDLVGYGTADCATSPKAPPPPPRPPRSLTFARFTAARTPTTTPRLRGTDAGAADTATTRAPCRDRRRRRRAQRRQHQPRERRDQRACQQQRHRDLQRARHRQRGVVRPDVCEQRPARVASPAARRRDIASTPTTDFAVNECCTLTVVASKVTTHDGDDPPDTMAADHTAIVPDRAAGALVRTTRRPTRSPRSRAPGSRLRRRSDTVVTVEAVVTAVRPGLSGFFIQEEVADQDTLPLDLGG